MHIMATCLHAAIKLQNDVRAREAILYFFRRLAQHENLRHTMRETQMTMVLSGLEKWEDSEDARAVVLPLADRLANDSALTLNGEQVSIIRSALRKWSHEEPAGHALRRLATLRSNAPSS